MVLPDSLVRRIEEIAAREGRTPEDLLQSLLAEYEQQSKVTDDSLEAFIGAFEDDVDDLSVTVRETLRRKFADDDGPA